MLKQKPLSYYQSSFLTKKSKKRQSSTSQNKQNIPANHNHSSSIQSSKINEKSRIFTIKQTKQTLIKDKNKKNKKADTRQRSTSRMSSDIFNHHNVSESCVKVSLPKGRENQNIQKKTKKTKNQSSFIDIHAEYDRMSSIMTHFVDQTSKKQRKVIVKKLNQHEILSKSSTIISSMGNIQFSDRSKNDEKNTLDNGNQAFYSINEGKKPHLTPNRAATLIQKTWRGYLTRKLLEEYIESFQPIYEEQLKQIRSGRQSNHQAKSNKKRHEKSSFFNDSQIEEYSQIRPSQINNQDSIVQKQSSYDKYDIPLQYFKKPSNSKNKKQVTSILNTVENKTKNNTTTKTNMRNASDKFNTRVSEFTIKNKPFVIANDTIQKECQQNQLQTIRQTTKNHHLKLQSRNISLAIQSQAMTTISSHFQSLQKSCRSLQKLFETFNSQCVSDLKAEIKLNRLNLTELMERKDALKDIVENGKEFVKNVGEEIQKALDQMKRITKEGCDEDDDEKQENSEVNLKDRGQLDEYQQSGLSLENGSLGIFGNKRKNRDDPSSEFYKIELPTEQYSIKGGSTIQEDFEQEEDLYASHNESPQSHHQSHISPQNSSPDRQPGYSYRAAQQSIQILNQFLLNLIQQFNEQQQMRNISQLQYLCETLKRVSCDSQNKTIIDRCLIQFMVEIMSETWTLREIYDGFRTVVGQRLEEEESSAPREMMQNGDESKLLRMISRWIEQLQKWEMNIIQQVPSRMQSSSFINTENISVHDLRQAMKNITNLQQSEMDFQQHH